MRRQIIAAAAALLSCLLWVSRASALPPVSLVEWDAPQACPGALDVYRRLQQALGGVTQTLDRVSRVRGTVLREANGYRLSLDMYGRGRRSSRVLESVSCDDLADAAAFAIKLALTPAGVGSGSPEPREEDGSSDGPAANPAPDAGTPLVDRAPPPTTVSRRTVLNAGVSASGVLELGALPRAAWGSALDAEVRLGATSLEAFADLFAAQRVALASAQSADFQLWVTGLRGCYAVVEQPLRLGACAGFEVGRFAASGVELDHARRMHDAWLAPSAAIAAQLPLAGPVALALRAESAFPLARKNYTVNGGDGVHAPALSSLRSSLGLTIAMP